MLASTVKTLNELRKPKSNKGVNMAPRRKYTSEEEQDLALTTVGDNDDMPSEDFESEYDENDDVEELDFDEADFGDESEYDEDYGTDSYSDID